MFIPTPYNIIRINTMRSTLSKEAITWDQKQYHIALCPEDISQCILLSGDPAGSDIAAKYPENAGLKATKTVRVYLPKN